MDVARSAAAAGAAGLAAASGLHAAWALGAAWPAQDRRALAAAVAGTDRLPGSTACWAVSGALTVAAGVTAGAGGAHPIARGGTGRSRHRLPGQSSDRSNRADLPAGQLDPVTAIRRPRPPLVRARLRAARWPGRWQSGQPGQVSAQSRPTPDLNGSVRQRPRLPQRPRPARCPPRHFPLEERPAEHSGSYASKRRTYRCCHGVSTARWW